MSPDQEWRALLLSEIRDIKHDIGELKSEMTTLKVKVALFSSAIGAIVGYAINRFTQG